MKQNVGTIDRIIRWFAAVICAILYATGTIEGTFGIVLLVLAIVFLLTSFLSFCPLYLPFGIRTCKKED
jgi:uncharacterized membrane protein